MAKRTGAFAVASRRVSQSVARSELLAEVAKLAREQGVMIHTHASENKSECEIVEERNR